MKRSAGFSVIELIVVMAIAAIGTSLILGAVTQSRRRAERAVCVNNMRQLGLALTNYHASQNALPAGISFEDDGQPSKMQYVTWLTRIMPQLDRPELWQHAVEAFEQDPFFLNNPPHTGLCTPVATLACPSDARAGQVGYVGYAAPKPYAFTSYLGVLGVNEKYRDGLLFSDSHVRFSEVADGLSQTLMIGERPPSADLILGWWYAGMGQRQNGDAEVVLGVRARCNGLYKDICEEGPYNFERGRFDRQCDAFHFWSPHAGGANFAFADGSVRFLSYSANDIMPALATRAGGEVVEVP